MKIETRDFGIIDVNEGNVITFKQPMYGFDEYRKFALLHNEEFGDQFLWLQSLEEKGLCFILIDPCAAVPDYVPEIDEATEKLIGSAEDCACWVTIAIPDDFRKSTINLKSPVIINLKTQSAVQIILEQDFPVRYPLMQGGK